MKIRNKFLLLLVAVLMVSGCTPKEMKTAYEKMEVGNKDGQIQSYSLSIRLFGLYNNEKIEQSYRVRNYLGKNFEVVDTSTDEEITYYLVDGVKYKSVVEKKRPSKDDLELEEDRRREPQKFAKVDEEIPFTNTHLYLKSLEKAKETSEPKEDTIAGDKFTTYEFMVPKATMLEILANSPLSKVEFRSNIPAKVWIDSEGYVYKIEFDLAKAVGSDSILGLYVYYNGINQIGEISAKNIPLEETEDLH